MYSRHDLVWLTPGGWQSALEQAEPVWHDALARWQREDWPAIVRRQDVDALASVVPVGVALPPDRATGVKPRIALRILATAIARHSTPIPIVQAVEAAPPRWQAALAAFAANTQDLNLKAYGSLALQAVTGQAYLTSSSDIDLLFAPASLSQLKCGIEKLSAACAHLPLDGEVVFPNGDAVAWKEWRDATAAGARVLVKSADTVRLANPAALLESLEAA